MDFPDAAAAYFALAELHEAMRAYLPLEPGQFRRLHDTADAARAWLDAHPAESRAHRIRGHMGTLHYALQRAAVVDDPNERITLWLLVQEAADDLAGLARDCLQADRDAITDTARQRRLEAEQAARALPRRADDELLRRIA